MADEQPLRLSPAPLPTPPPPVDLLVNDQEEEEGDNTQNSDISALALVAPAPPAAPAPPPFASGIGSGFDIDSFTRDHLHCPSCGKYYDDPRTLPCLHSYCRECLEKEARKQREERERECEEQAEEEPLKLEESCLETLRSYKVSADPLDSIDNFDCPQGCQCPTGIKFDRGGDIDHIPPPNKFLDNMVKDVRLKNEVPAGKILCAKCDDGNVAIAKLECANLPLCSNCLKTHLKTSKTMRHTIVPVYPEIVGAIAMGDSNVSGDGGEGSPPPSWKNFERRNWLCDFHPNHPVDRYCYKHEQVICLNCSILGDDNKGHRGCGRVEQTEDVVDVEKIAVDEVLDEVKGIRAKIIKAINEIEIMKKSLTNTRNWIISIINEHCDELIGDLERQRESLINQTEQIHNEKMANLKEHQNRFKRISDTLQRSVDFIGDSVNMTIPTEFMFLKESFLKRLNYLIDHYKDCNKLPSDVNDRIYLKLNDDFSMEGPLGQVVGTPFIENYTLESFPNPVRARKTYSFKIQSRDICRTEVAAGNVPMLEATICSLASLEPVQCFVKLNSEEGVYTVYFYPLQAGRHKVSVYCPQAPPLGDLFVSGFPRSFDVRR